MSKNNTHPKRSAIKGSFLLELLVAFAIISIALTVVVDSFISSQKSYRMIAAQTNLTRSLSMVLEDMSQEARVSEDYGCGTGSPAPCSASSVFSMSHIVGLNNQLANENISYTLTDKEIIKNISGVDSKMTTNTKVEITQFSVEVKQDSGTHLEHAFVTLTAHSKENPDIKVHLQTSFAERLY
jgi:type II secretory pathway pseudopilin PulG